MSQDKDIHAHWIETPTYGLEMDYAYTIYVCSHCGDSVDKLESFRMKCPHCGAIMDEKEKHRGPLHQFLTKGENSNEH